MDTGDKGEFGRIGAEIPVDRVGRTGGGLSPFPQVGGGWTVPSRSGGCASPRTGPGRPPGGHGLSQAGAGIVRRVIHRGAGLSPILAELSTGGGAAVTGWHENTRSYGVWRGAGVTGVTGADLAERASFERR